jgi:AI-2 transport protein TqsA
MTTPPGEQQEPADGRSPEVPGSAPGRDVHVPGPDTGMTPAPEDAQSFSARAVPEGDSTTLESGGGQPDGHHDGYDVDNKPDDATSTDADAGAAHPAGSQGAAGGEPDPTPSGTERAPTDTIRSSATRSGSAGSDTVGAGGAATARRRGVTRLDGPDPDAEITASAGEKRLADEEKTKYAMPRFVAVTLGVAALVVVLYLVKDLSAIIAPFFLGLNLMIAVQPIHRLLARVMPRFIAAFISLISVLAILIGFIWGCVWALLELVKALPQYNQEFTKLWLQIVDLTGDLGLDPQWITNALGSINPSDVMSLVGPVLANMTSIISLLTTLVMATFFMAMDTPSMASRMKLLRVVQPRALAVVMDFSTGVRRYWVVATLFGLIVAILDVAALAIIGVPLIWVWGVLAFVTNYIPNIGFVVGLVPPALLALLDGGWQPAVIVVIVYCLLNFVIQVLIQPKITGESVGVTGTISFLSLLVWVVFLGPLGALLALPATLLVKALLVDADPRARWLNTFIASSPDTALPDDERPEPRSARKRRLAQERSALYGG